ncbi:MAG: NAD(P)-binding protein, partial [Bacteroidota bacterium]
MRWHFRKSLQHVFTSALNTYDDSFLASRRKFMAQVGLLSSAYLMNPRLFPNIYNPDILIIGGGIAGLNAAYTFKKQGFTVPVYEASNRVGGRMMTLSNYFGNNLNTEMGGEFIDTFH